MRDAESERLSDATCTALQLANFWQDVKRDLAMGRIYLPQEDLARFGVTETDLAAEKGSGAFRQLMQFEVERARALFAQGLPLLDRVSGHLRVDLVLFSRGGLAILDKIERQGYDTLVRRPQLSPRRQGPDLPPSLGPTGPRPCASAGKRPRLSREDMSNTAALAHSYALAARTTRREAGNFYVAFLTLPREQRRAVYALYAFFRELDNVADAAANAPDDGAHPLTGKRDAARSLRTTRARVLSRAHESNVRPRP